MQGISADALTLITVVTPSEKKRARRQNHISKTRPGTKALFPTPIAFASDANAMYGDILFEYGDSINDKYPQAEVVLNQLEIENFEAGEDPVSMKKNRNSMSKKIRVLGVCRGSHDLDSDTTMPIPCINSGIVTLNNSGTVNIKPGELVVAQIPSQVRKIAQRMSQSMHPRGDNVRKLETVPFKKAEMTFDLKQVLMTKDMLNLFLFFTSLCGTQRAYPATQNERVISTGIAMGELTLQPTGVLGDMHYGADDKTRMTELYLEMVRQLTQPGNERAAMSFSQALVKSSRMIVASSHCNVLGVAQSGAEPNQPFNIALSPVIRTNMIGAHEMF
jgi:hypothetical protein